MNLITENASWQQQLRDAFTDIDTLLDYLNLSREQLPISSAAEKQFELRVPLSFAKRMRCGDPDDPLLKQVLPVEAEMRTVPGFTTDPLEEEDSRVCDGLIHKYQDRVLLIGSGACAINCRYCFRRHFPYADNQLGPQQWQQVLTYITDHPQVREVLFSGGDPLATSDSRLQRMVNGLAQIPHLKRIRIHSRLPVVIPARITDELVATLSQTRLQATLVLHANHAHEITDEIGTIAHKLRSAGVTVLNQSVLLRGINDNVDALEALSEATFAAGILPYYLFVLDPVSGSAHFDVSDDEARALFAELQTRISGYLVPRLAREIAGRPSKTLLLPDS